MSQTLSVAIVRRTALIVTGIFLYLFVTSHLVNLILGLISVELMDAARPWLSGMWSGPFTRNILMMSLMIHFFLALYSLYLRNTLRVSTYDAVQLGCGILIIPLLAPHVTGIAATEQLGAPTSYIYLLPYFWVDSPGDGLRQVILLTVVWLHGSIGIFTWLRAQEARRSILVVAYPVFVGVPILALLGYVEAGLQVIPQDMGGSGAALAQVEAVFESFSFPDDDVIASVVETKFFLDRMIVWGSLGLVALVLLLRYRRISLLPRDETVNVIYSDELPSTISAGSGLTLLELAREANLPHASLCQGRGRCGTCRVRILSSTSNLPAPQQLEQKTLSRFSCPKDVRLACQLAPGPGRLELERIVAPDYSDLEIHDAQARARQPEAAE
ncbi:MAG: 2Fe-2S iron-sulfur cluster-binding protein [Pseudomonadota bacterium]